jgi:eukaryotic-like serine/threonine-protein kinase
MSHVYRGVDERLHREVAIKLLDDRTLASADPAGRDRFLRESRTMASFTHQHAVTVFDAGQDGGDLFIVMELVDGPSLAGLLAGAPLDPERAVAITQQVLSALAAAHDAGIVHRDVKPANVLIDAGGQTKLADFGIAKQFDDLEEAVTMAGFVVGTPRYLAPEQAAGRPTGPPTDIYAVGLLLAEMLADDVPAPLAGVVAQATADDPADRYPTALSMSASIASAWPPGFARGADEPTLVMRSETDHHDLPDEVRSGHTVVMPVLAPPDPRGPRRRLGWSLVVPLGLVVVATLVLALLFVTSVSRDPEMVGMPVPTDGASSTELAAATPADPTPAESTPAEDVSSPPVSAPVTPDEVVPGFPATDDLLVFLAQVEQYPTLVGDAGTEVVEKLQPIIRDEPARKQEKAAPLARQ